jgi:hypothetical protein
MRINASPYIRALRLASRDKASLLVGWAENTGIPDVFVLHEVLGNVAKSNVRVTSDTPQALETSRLDFGSLAPFTSGVATLHGQGAPNTTTQCDVTSRQVTMTGTVTAHFDGYGTMTMTGGSGSVTRTAG